MKKIIILILSILMTLDIMFSFNMSAVQAESSLLPTWNYRKNNNSAVYSLKSIALSGNTGVAVGESGAILQTKDKATWNLIPGIRESLSGIVYAKTKFFMVGQGGGIYSLTGNNVPIKIAAIGTPLNGIIYGNNILVAFGQNGGAYSSNGTTWTKFTLPTEATAYCGTFGNSRFIIAGENGKIFISIDGKKWVEGSDPNITDNIYGVAFGKETYLIAGSNQLLATSIDGHAWTKQISPLNKAEFAGAIYANGHFIAWSLLDSADMGDSVSNKKAVFYFVSPDGKAWKNDYLYVDHSQVKSSWIYGITLGNDGNLYGVGDDGVIEKSKDGLRWSFLNSTTNSLLYDIVKNGNTYVAVGVEDDTDGAIFISNDGYNWKQQNNPEIPTDKENLYLFPKKKILHTIAYGKGTYVIGGESGMLMYSKNAIDWNIVKSPVVDESIVQIEFIGGKFIGITDKGSIVASYDGINWNEGALKKDDFTCLSMAFDEKGNIVIEGSQYSSGHFSPTMVYCFNSSEIDPSGKNKATWKTPQTVSDNSNIFMGIVCYGKGTFVITGVNGNVFTSTDRGVTWKSHSAFALYGGMASTTYGHNHFVSVGSDQKIATSPDGITWKIVSSALGSIGEEFSTVFLSSDFSYIFTSNSRILYATNGLENWMDSKIDENYTINDVIYTSNFGFVGTTDNGFLILSKDGTVWGKLEVPGCGDNITNIFYITNSKTFLVGTEHGMLYSTKDFITWTSYPVPGGSSINAVASNGKIVIAASGEGASTIVLISDVNCEKWVINKLNLGGTITGLTYAKNYFVAVGANGNIRYSKDGRAWSKATVATTNNFTSIAICGDRFIAVGVAGTIAYSFDGYSKWTVVKTNFKDTLFDICYNNGICLATSDNGKVYMSQNKTNWKMFKAFDFGTFYAGAVNQSNVFVIVGSDGLIMQSLPIIHL